MNEEYNDYGKAFVVYFQCFSLDTSFRFESDLSNPIKWMIKNGIYRFDGCIRGEIELTID